MHLWYSFAWLGGAGWLFAYILHRCHLVLGWRLEYPYGLAKLFAQEFDLASYYLVLDLDLGLGWGERMDYLLHTPGSWLDFSQSLV